MPFQMLEKCMGAIDAQNGATLKIGHTTDIEYRIATYSSIDHEILVSLRIERKFPNIPAKNGDLTNPSVLIISASFNWYFHTRNLLDVEQNTALVLHIIRMIAFVNQRFPQSRSPFLWSNYKDFSGRLTEQGGQLLFRMPSDEELLKISLQPE